MAEDASPFFIRPHRFDDPAQDDTYFPRLDWHRRLVLEPDEQVLWRDEVDVAGHLLAPDDSSGELVWTLPRRAEVTVTDRRLAYVCVDWRIGSAPVPWAGSRQRRRSAPIGSHVVTGQIRWQWPSALRILPATGPEDGGRNPERLLVVCDAVRSTGRPALALSGGTLGSARTVRRVATLIRRGVAGFRLANPTMVELAPPEWDALLARAGLAPFADALADPERGVDLPGALPVEFAHRDDYYRRSLRRRNAPTAGWAATTPGRNSPGRGRSTVVSPTRWSDRQPGSAS